MLIHFHNLVGKIKNTPAQKSKIIIISTFLSFLFNLTIWGLIYFQFYPLVKNLPPELSFIPLHYNVYLGVDMFGHWQKILILPAIGLLIFFVNTILSFLIYNKKEVLSYFLSIGSLLCQIFLIIATILTILINI